MNLFIIGNGFDIGHGLPTKYWDFRTYLYNMYPFFLERFEEHYEVYPGMTNKAKQELLWNELETNLANIDDDIIIENAENMSLDLDGGDIGIEDTLYEYFRDEFDYISNLAKYLKQWIRTIRIRDIKKRTSLICPDNDNQYLTFNYTAVLETVYGISESQILHIHGSLRNKDGNPILGHGNQLRITEIQEKKKNADDVFDEKTSSACRIIEDYYMKTYKNVRRLAPRLYSFINKGIQDVYVIGCSLAGVDMLYYRIVDDITGNKATWNVYYFKEEEKQKLLNNLREIEIDFERINLIPTTIFYDL